MRCTWSETDLSVSCHPATENWFGINREFNKNLMNEAVKSSTLVWRIEVAPNNKSLHGNVWIATGSRHDHQAFNYTRNYDSATAIVYTIITRNSVLVIREILRTGPLSRPVMGRSPSISPSNGRLVELIRSSPPLQHLNPPAARDLFDRPEVHHHPPRSPIQWPSAHCKSLYFKNSLNKSLKINLVRYLIGYSANSDPSGSCLYVARAWVAKFVQQPWKLSWKLFVMEIDHY